jgi:hypothetical protein
MGQLWKEDEAPGRVHVRIEGPAVLQEASRIVEFLRAVALPPSVPTAVGLIAVGMAYLKLSGADEDEALRGVQALWSLLGEGELRAVHPTQGN